LEENEERRREVKKEKRDNKALASESEPYRDTTATIVMASSLVKETRAPLTMGSSRTCFNERNRINKCSKSMLQSESRVYTMKPIYHKDRQKK